MWRQVSRRPGRSHRGTGGSLGVCRPLRRDEQGGDSRGRLGDCRAQENKARCFVPPHHKVFCLEPPEGFRADDKTVRKWSRGLMPVSVPVSVPRPRESAPSLLGSEGTCFPPFPEGMRLKNGPQCKVCRGTAVFWSFLGPWGRCALDMRTDVGG